MRFRAVAAAMLIVALLTPSSAFAWGYAGHRLIMRRAIDLLPPELKTFFDLYREPIVMRAIDPDLWRNVGIDEGSHHFLDFGAREFGEYPFAALPREYGAAIEKFGRTTLEREGTVPWRVEEMFGNVRRVFESFKGSSYYGSDDLVLFSAVLGHYTQDAHQPFHASNNFDGQLTGNDGIHARFERDLIEKFEARLTLDPKPASAIRNPRDAAFDALLASYKDVDAILQADTAAVAGKDEYDADYFEKFFTRVKPILEERLSSAITATASMIVGAWDAAGRPTPAVRGARPVEKVKKPRP